MVSEGNIHILSRTELNSRMAREFKHGDLVICGKYYIHIKWRKHDADESDISPSLFSTVSTRDDIRNLPMHKHPYYIRDFIERRKEQL